MRLRIGHLYPHLMNIYGDRGNVIALKRRCEWRGFDVAVEPIELGDCVDLSAFDILFMGGGQDREQRMVCEDFAGVKGASLMEAVDAETVVLAVCGGYQLMGHSYVDAEGRELPGLGLFDAWTVSGRGRLIGNVVVESLLEDAPDRTLVGFENHGGRTRLGPGCRPLGRVRSGRGNNGEDGTEGAVSGTAYGTYLHGSLLPKNPWFADRLILEAARRHDGGFALDPLDDRAEFDAHAAALRVAHGK